LQNVQFVTQIPGGETVPVADNVNAVLNESVTQMAQNALNGLIAAKTIEQHSETGQTTTYSLDITLNFSEKGGVSVKGGGSKTFQVASPEAAALQVDNANTKIQGATAQRLENMYSNVAGNPAVDPPQLRNVPAANGSNMAAALAERARMEAPKIAEQYYKRFLNNQPLPQTKIR
jgi:hypothetical protein